MENKSFGHSRMGASVVREAKANLKGAAVLKKM